MRCAGDLNPNNVLLKSAITDATSSNSQSAAETSERLSRLYRGLASGFCTKVGDFGLAMKLGEHQTHLSNMRQGTPFYVAPVCDTAPERGLRVACGYREGVGASLHSLKWSRQAQETQSEGLLTKAADVYALGVLFWEVFHSRPCFRKTRAGFCIRDPAFPRFPPTCPLAYALLAVACLHPDPKTRCVQLPCVYWTAVDRWCLPMPCLPNIIVAHALSTA